MNAAETLLAVLAARSAVRAELVALLDAYEHTSGPANEGVYFGVKMALLKLDRGCGGDLIADAWDVALGGGS